MRKWYSLIDKVYNVNNLRKAYWSVRRNRGSRSSGVDGQSIQDFSANLEAELLALSEALRSGSYVPQAVKRVWIDKQDGSQRGLGIPTIRDRVVQQSLLNVLEPIFDPDFHPSSYGYRPKLSAHHAVAKAERFMHRYQLHYVADLDLTKCFDSLDHALILGSLNRKVSDGKVLGLVKSFLESGVLTETGFVESHTGSPQGGIISPLLMNIYLDHFDQKMRSKGIRIVRYADDILLFGLNKSELQRHYHEAVKVLEFDLKLTINKSKSRMTDLWIGVDYLGFRIGRHGVSVSSKSIKRFKDKVRNLTPRNSGMRFSQRIKSLNYLLRGFSNYFRLGQVKSLFFGLMKWIRRRLRAMKMKSWKSWRMLHKQLRRVGYKGEYVKIRVDKWRNSGSILAQIALSNEWFREQGLYDMQKAGSNTLHQYYDSVLNKV